MKLEQRNKNWWITNVPDAPDCGPYDTKRDAKEDMDGMAAFIKADSEGDLEFIFDCPNEVRLWKERKQKLMEQDLANMQSAVKEVLYDLIDKHGEASDARVHLSTARTLLRKSLECLLEECLDITTAVLCAKNACEEIATQAGKAFENGDEDFRNHLADQLNIIAPCVEKLLPRMMDEDAKTA